LVFSLALLFASTVVGLLQDTPQLTSLATLPVTKLLGHGLDLGLLAITLGLLLLMPVMPGGWEATVDEEERHRVLAGTVVEEKEDMAENYDVSLPSPLQIPNHADSYCVPMTDVLLACSYVLQPQRITPLWRLL
jgi:hypothetical protein